MEKILSKEELLKLYAQAWNELNADIIAPYLAPDYQYGSMYVLEEMHGKDKYLEYLRGKFDTIRRTGSLVEARLGTSSWSRTQALILDQCGCKCCIEVKSENGLLLSGYLLGEGVSPEQAEKSLRERFRFNEFVLPDDEYGAPGDLQDMAMKTCQALDEVWKGQYGNPRHSDTYILKEQLRACWTIGIGAGYWWDERKEDFKEKGILDSLAGPRGIFYLDDDIEDRLGICWGSEMSERYHEILHELAGEAMKQYYEDYALEKKRVALGRIFFLLGANMGFVRQMHDALVTEASKDQEVFGDTYGAIYGEEGKANFHQMTEKIRKENALCDCVTTECQITPDKPRSLNTIHVGQYPKEHPQARLQIGTSIYVKGKEAYLQFLTPVFEESSRLHCTIEKIYEWSAGSVAVLELRAPGYYQTIRVLDTQYFKDKYLLLKGKEYDIAVTALGVGADVPDEKEVVVSGERARQIREWLSMKDDGKEDLHISMTKMVSLFMSQDTTEFADFYSPLFSDCEPLEFFGQEFLKTRIGILREGDDTFTVPLYIRKDRIPQGSKKDSPLQGQILLYGHL